MNQKANSLWLPLLLLIGVLLAGAIIATASVWQYTINEESTDTTLSLAFTEAQVTAIAAGAIGGTAQEVELATINGYLVYVVEVVNNEEHYEVQIDPTTGAIVSVAKETAVGKEELDVVQPRITEQQAEAIALSHVSGTVKDIDLEKINDRYVYEVELDRNGQEVEVAIDIMNGDVLSIEEEEVLPASIAMPTPSTSTELTREEMEAIAIEKVGGSATDFERKGTYLYEVEVQTSSGETDVVIDSRTGEIVRIERD